MRQLLLPAYLGLGVAFSWALARALVDPDYAHLPGTCAGPNGESGDGAVTILKTGLRRSVGEQDVGRKGSPIRPIHQLELRYHVGGFFYELFDLGTAERKQRVIIGQVA